MGELRLPLSFFIFLFYYKKFGKYDPLFFCEYGETPPKKWQIHLAVRRCTTLACHLTQQKFLEFGEYGNNFGAYGRKLGEPTLHSTVALRWTTK